MKTTKYSRRNDKAALRRLQTSLLMASVALAISNLPAQADRGDFAMNFGNMQQQVIKLQPTQPQVVRQIPTVSMPRINPNPVNIVNVSLPITRVMPTPTLNLPTRIPVNIDSFATKTMPVRPIMPTMPMESFTPKSFNQPMVTRVATPVALPAVLNAPKNFDPTPSFDVDARTISVDSNDASRGRDSGRRIQFQAALPTPGVNENIAQPDVSAGANPAAQQANEVPSQLFVGNRGLGTVVTSDYIDGGVDAETIKKATNEKLTMFEGTTLFVPDHEMVIETPHGKLHIGNKSVVLVTSNLDQMAVYDIHDEKKGSIYVESGDKKFRLAPGRHVVISNDQSGDFAMANAIENIPHNDVARLFSGNSKSVFTSSFSIPAAIQCVGSLKSLATSDDRDLQRIGNQIMKTAAIVMHMNNAQYRHYMKSRVTLLSQQ